jgi:hypothetical protein
MPKSSTRSGTIGQQSCRRVGGDTGAEIIRYEIYMASRKGNSTQLDNVHHAPRDRSTIPPILFVAEGDQRVHPASAPGRNVAGE